jgi:hypothetical protein
MTLLNVQINGAFLTPNSLAAERHFIDSRNISDTAECFANITKRATHYVDGKCRGSVEEIQF